MAQRVNPIIYRLGAAKLWNSKYIENKKSEQSHIEFKNLEIKKFTLKFFKDKGFNVHEYKINYSNNGYLNIFLSCYKLPTKTLPNNQTNNSSNLLETKLLTAKDYHNYKILNYSSKISNQNYSAKKLISIKKKLDNKYSNLTNYNENFNTSIQTIKKKEISFFLNNFIESLLKFLDKKLTVVLTFQIITKTIKNQLNRKNIDFIQKKIIRLNKYKQNNFFNEGINTLYICSKQPNSANLLADFIAVQLKKNKKQYNKFFLNFIKKCLQSFKKENPLKTNNIKIQIKGRLSRSSRAKKIVLNIANNLPILTIKANLDYSERVSFTSNGTVGVKVWIYNQN